MRVTGKMILAAGLLGMCLTLTSRGVHAADEEKLIPREGAIELMLLLQKSVRDDLKLNMQEISKIDEFCAKQWAHAQEYHKLPDGERKTKFEELGKANKEFIEKTLMPEQTKRLKQIAMQEGGLLWVTDPKVSQELGITEQQKAQIMELQKQAEKQVEGVFHSGNTEGISEKLETLRHEHHKQLLSVLNEQQKAKWKEMVGEPFHGKLVFLDFEGKKP